MAAWLYLSTMVLEATLTDDQDVAVAGATVTATLVDRAGAEVAGVEWPQAMAEQGAGVYSVRIGREAEVQRNGRYFLRVDAEAPGGATRYAELLVTITVDHD